MIKINVAECVGCRTCELICSYHHRQCFNPDYSSIKIFYDNNYNVQATIVQEDCDCNNFEALCVNFCPVKAIEIEK